MERYVVLTGEHWPKDVKNKTFQVYSYYNVSCHIMVSGRKWWVDLADPTGPWGGTIVGGEAKPDKLDDIKKIIEEALLNEGPLEDCIMAILNVIDRKS